MRTTMTALVQVTSHGSGGRAKIIDGNPFLTDNFSDDSLTSKRFTNYAIGTRLVVRLRVNPDSRRIESVVTDWLSNIYEFRTRFAETLMEENEKFEKMRVIWGVTKFDGSDSTTSEETPKASSFVVKNEWVGNMYIPEKFQKVFESARRASENLPAKVLMVGPSGYGKTSVPEAMASEFGLDFMRVNCATMRDTTDWLGYQEAVDGTTVVVKSPLAEKMAEGNVIIVLDEFNRVQPWVHNVLFPLFDDAAKTTWKNETFEVGPNTIFVFTINFGWQYAGTFELDGAMMNRVDMTLHVGALPKHIEVTLLQKKFNVDRSTSIKIVETMTRLRKLWEEGKISADCSTRTSLKVAKQFGFGVLTLSECFEAIVRNPILESEEAKVVHDVLASSDL